MILEILVQAPHFRDRKTEAQRGEDTSARSHSQGMAESYWASEETCFTTQTAGRKEPGREQGAGLRSPPCAHTFSEKAQTPINHLALTVLDKHF